MHRPLFLEGDAGVGKTSLAQALAAVLGARLVRLQCYEGIDAAQALYDWDFPRQVLHLRAAETAGQHDAEQLERSLYDRRVLVARPVLQAIEHSPSVLLVDEIDRADDEFEAFLLEVLADNAVTVPEIGTIRAKTPPVVVLTSNRTREVHDALKRRCLYHWVPHPSYEREVATLRHAGVPATPHRVQAMVAALGHLDVLDPSHTYWAGRLTLCGDPSDVERYDAAFAAYFGGRTVQQARRAATSVRQRVEPIAMETPDGLAPAGEDEPHVSVLASRHEVLRHRDVAALTAAEREQLRRLLALLAPRVGRRRTRRYGPSSV